MPDPYHEPARERVPWGKRWKVTRIGFDFWKERWLDCARMRETNPLFAMDTIEKTAFIKNNGYIDPRFTFENLVVAPNNETCVLAAKLIVDQPGEIYNPLYIYGGDGLGKTHLIHAIANACIVTGKMKVVCKSAEMFLNDAIVAIRGGKTQELHHQYRDVDVLMIDDIQFIVGKRSTQKELLCIFDALYEFNTQIVLTSDCAPDERNDLGERIRSRFQTGLVMEMKIPSFETRLAILSKKAEVAKILLDDDAAYLLASRYTTNVRELEGALTKLVAYAAVTEAGVKINKVSKGLREEMAAGFEMLGDKVNGMDVRDNTLGQKVEGHEDRIRFLERKVA